MGQTVLYPATTGKGLFDGTNGTGLTAAGWDAGNWANPNSGSFNNCAIRGTPGVGASGASSHAILNGIALSASQYCQITLDSANFADTLFYIALREQNDGTGNSYLFGYNQSLHADTRWTIAKFAAGVSELLTSATLATHNDVLTVTASGTTISLYVNDPTLSGSPLLSTTDATYASGFAGLLLDDRTGNNLRLAGSFSAGNLSSGGLFLPNPMTGLAVGGPFFANPLG